MPQEEYDFESILRVLAKHDVDYIVVGGLCAVLHGAPVQTYDLDIVHSRESANLYRLERALGELGAYYREHRHRRIVPEAARLAGSGHHLLGSSAGPIDVLGSIAGQRDYITLLAHTVELVLDDSTAIRILDLETLILTKQEAGRRKDLLMLPILIRTLEEVERGHGRLSEEDIA